MATQFLSIGCLFGVASSCLVAAVFGTVVPIGGHASDLAFDGGRHQLYIANFAGKRVDVMSTADNSLKTSIPLGNFAPGSLALSPDGRFLLVTNYTKITLPNALISTVAVIDLESMQITFRAISNGASPLALGFGNGSNAFLVTTKGMYLIDPLTGIFQQLPQPPILCSQSIPVPFATFPPQILEASSGVSGDGQTVVVLAELGTGVCSSGSSVVIRFDVITGKVTASQLTSSPPGGPRVISPDRTGSTILAGWALLNRSNTLLAEFPYPTGVFEVGSHAFDWLRDAIYAHVPSNATDPASDLEPVLQIIDTDNLTVRERIRIPERLAGRSIFSADMNTLYSISDSGVTVFPIASLATARRVSALQEQLVFRATSCENGWISQTLDIADLGGGQTDFVLSIGPSIQGVRFSQTSGTTPARVIVQVDPVAFRPASGTTSVPLEIVSAAAINVVKPVRLLVNTKNPDQRGSIHSLPGTLVDILSDTLHGRIYILRQDRNQILVLDATTFEIKATLRTGNTPTQMAMTRDGRYLMAGNDHSQIGSLFDLQTLTSLDPILFPAGHYPRSFAVSRSRIMAISRDVSSSTAAVVDFVTLGTLPEAVTPLTLGIYMNSLPSDSMLMASPSGRSIVAMAVDSTLVSYNDDYDAFQASRKDGGALAGAYAALSDNTFIVGGSIYNNSLVNVGTVDGGSSVNGVMGWQESALTVRAATPASDAVVEWVSIGTGEVMRPVRAIEAPVMASALQQTGPVGQIGQTILSFGRPLTMTGDGSAVYLSTSGITVLPAGFDQPLPPPMISSITNLADGGAIAPGSLIQILGSGLSAAAATASGLPLPTGLAEMCAIVSTTSFTAPLPLWQVASSSIQAQMPFEASGSATLTVYAPGGRSAPFEFALPNTAPAIFRSQGNDTVGLPLVYRAVNNDLLAFSNPIHPGDVLLIYATGLGQTSPPGETGAAAPSDPLAYANFVPTVTVGNRALKVTFAGLAPGNVGVYQINAVVPGDIPGAQQTAFIVAQGGSSTTFQVRVVNP